MTSAKISIILFLLISQVNAQSLVHTFNNPSFSGIGTSSHWLTIENQENSRESDIKAELKAYEEELARDADNTTLARFIRNVESRVYAQLSRQLVDNLFGENPSESGSIELLGSTITFESDGEMVKLTITDADGNTTEITVPIGSFTF
jgi:curli production assembly/transport component CsgF